MKLSTTMYARFSSPGHPNQTLDCHGNVVDIVRQFVQWLADSTVNQRVEFQLARTPEGIIRGKGASAGIEAAMADILSGITQED